MRSIRREITLVVLGGLALAVTLTWPTLRHPATTIPQDPYDPLLEAWSAAWGGHAVLTAPRHLFDANAFWPLSNSYAFTDSLLGYAPLGFLGSGPTAALVRYNVLYVLVAALAFIGAYLLARQLGSGPIGAIVAGAAFGFAPWRLAQAGHLHVLSTGAVPLALALLLRGHGYGGHGYRTERVRAGWLAAGWAVAAWQLTIGFSIGLPFTYLLAVLVVISAAGWFVARRPPLPTRLVVTDLLGGAGFAAVAAAMAWPYLQVLRAHPEAHRGLADVAAYSPPLRGFLIAPGTSVVWSRVQAGPRATLPFPPEMMLLPGAVLIVLAAVGVGYSVWSWRRRLGQLVVVVVSVVLGAGTSFPGGGRWTYAPLLRVLPGWDALRTPGRLIVFTTLALGLLAAGAVTAATRRVASWRAGVATPALLLLPALVLAEGINTTPHPVVPAEPAAVRAARGAGPVLVLPSDTFSDNAAMYWSTDGFFPLVNGNSGFVPTELAELRNRAVDFPDAASVSYLRARGIRSVVLLPWEANGTPWQDSARHPIHGLGVVRQRVGAGWVYDLAPPHAHRAYPSG